MTILPPSWRLADWYVVTWLERFFNFDPFPMVVAGIVLTTVFSACFCCLTYRLIRLYADAGLLPGQRSAGSRANGAEMLAHSGRI